MNVLFAVAEMAPLAKVGGVGDVSAGLPRALRRLGLDVRVALPLYASIDRDAHGLSRLAALPDGAALWEAEVRGVPTYLIEHEAAFGRELVYGYEDDPKRFLAFCDALLAASEVLDWQPDAVHAHDWHTGFTGARLAAAADHAWADAARIFTIHNLGYRGEFDDAFAAEHGLPAWAFAAPPGVAVEVARSGLGLGLLHAGRVSTVSPTYAREILAPEQSDALAPLLARLPYPVAGVLNGIDTDEWDPATDERLAARFDAERLDRRRESKRALRERLGLADAGEAPVIGMVSRLVVQKGADLAVAAIDRLLKTSDLQLAVLGVGEETYEQAMTALAERHPGRAAVRLAFDEELGQLIYGGSDLFLMPSRYEPCGLGQLIAMRYGAVTVVRRTGGLADTVSPYDAARDEGTGFVFDDATPDALVAALEAALAAYRDRDGWWRLQRRAMAQDFSWGRSARNYAELYEGAIGERSATRGAR